MQYVLYLETAHCCTKLRLRDLAVAVGIELFESPFQQTAVRARSSAASGARRDCAGQHLSDAADDGFQALRWGRTR